MSDNIEKIQADYKTAVERNAASRRLCTVDCIKKLECLFYSRVEAENWLLNLTNLYQKNVLIWSLGECFSEAESASIRSAAKFCFDLDVRIFVQLFKKIFFLSIQKYFSKFLEIFGHLKIFKNPY